jgi:hypothetical protein
MKASKALLARVRYAESCILAVRPTARCSFLVVPLPNALTKQAEGSRCHVRCMPVSRMRLKIGRNGSSSCCRVNATLSRRLAIAGPENATRPRARVRCGRRQDLSPNARTKIRARSPCEILHFLHMQLLAALNELSQYSCSICPSLRKASRVIMSVAERSRDSSESEVPTRFGSFLG